LNRHGVGLSSIDDDSAAQVKQIIDPEFGKQDKE
jgi:hypothetical protein